MGPCERRHSGEPTGAPRSGYARGGPGAEISRSHNFTMPTLSEKALKCERCGCSEHDACVDEQHKPCGWARPGLCTHCYDNKPVSRPARLALTLSQLRVAQVNLIEQIAVKLLAANQRRERARQAKEARG